MAALDWGRHFLMCPPDHFQVTYEINPWMHADADPVDSSRAAEQWERLAATLTEAGARVETLPPIAGLPDMVFTANAGLVNGATFVPARFRNPERQPETRHGVAWFADRGGDVAPLPTTVVQEGAGDALPFGSVLVAGFGTRSTDEGARRAATAAGFEPLPVRLVDDRLYHLDLAFCPLDDRRAIVVPDAFDEVGRRAIQQLVPEPLVLELPEALQFAANSVVVGRTIVMPACPPRVGRQLERWGFEPVVLPVDEFQKAGGACRCLTLALDVCVPAPSGTAEAAA